LLTPATLLGTPTEAGLNQKNATSLTLGTHTAFDFYPPKFVGGQALYLSRRLYPKMLNGDRKSLSNLVLNCVTYLWDTTLYPTSEAVKWDNGKEDSNTSPFPRFSFLRFPINIYEL
jgi:hypothetical protein